MTLGQVNVSISQSTCPERLILRNFQSLGDIVILTALVRDIHRCYPGRFLTDVRTFYPDLWLHNPWLFPLQETDSDVRTIDCDYPLIEYSNERPYHFLHGFTHALNRKLRLAIYPTEFRGDIHLSTDEPKSALMPILNGTVPYWLIVSGGKRDFTVKWWSAERYQRVIDRFQGRIMFVQVGDRDDAHSPLQGVVDLRGRTSIRELVLLVHHAQGVVCPITGMMHLAAAVPPKDTMNPLRPCVVIAGAREPPHWTAYPGHQFVHKVGMLPCCAKGGCWRSRVWPLGDGSQYDHPDSLCLSPTTENLPKCMSMITVEEIVQRIEGYFTGGLCEYLSPYQQALAARATNLSNFKTKPA